MLRRELSRKPAPRPADALALGLELGSSAPHALSYPEVREDVLLADRAAARVDSLTGGELAELCEPLARMAWTVFYLDRYPEAERHADRGLALVRRVGPLHLLPHLLLCKAVVHMNSCRLVSALELVDESESIARGIGSDELLGLILGNKAQILLAALPPGRRHPAGRGGGGGRAVRVAQQLVDLAGLVRTEFHRPVRR